MKKGWKVFDKDLCCRGMQYEIGKSYTHSEEIELCTSGFHFHENKNDLFNYYEFDSANRVCEITAHQYNNQKVITGDDKSVCAKITILKELSWNEVLNLVNTGKNNTGRRNSGHMNSGYSNSGDWNSGNYSSGIFCVDKNPEIKIFDKKSDMTMEDWNNSEYCEILSKHFILNQWIDKDDMTDQEKKDNPKFYVMGGYLKTFEYKEACKNMWKKMSDSEKETIKSIPNFDTEKFEEITGIKS